MTNFFFCFFVADSGCQILLSTLMMVFGTGTVIYFILVSYLMLFIYVCLYCKLLDLILYICISTSSFWVICQWLKCILLCVNVIGHYTWTNVVKRIMPDDAKRTCAHLLLRSLGMCLTGNRCHATYFRRKSQAVYKSRDTPPCRHLIPGGCIKRSYAPPLYHTQWCDCTLFVLHSILVLIIMLHLPMYLNKVSKL